jgi:hypothetical protein
VDDALGRHVVEQLIYQSVALSVQLVLGDADMEQLQVTHVLPATQTGQHFQHQQALSCLPVPVPSGQYNKQLLPATSCEYVMMHEIPWGGGGEQETISTVLKVPKQWPLVLLVEIMHTIGIMRLEGLHCSEI